MFDDGRTNRPLEKLHPEMRVLMERAYVADPRATASELVSSGYWTISAQLKIDLESGLLK